MRGRKVVVVGDVEADCDLCGEAVAHVASQTRNTRRVIDLRPGVDLERRSYLTCTACGARRMVSASR